MTIKATLLKYADMSLAALTQLKSFMQRTPTLFDVQCFNNNPALRIAEAKNAAGHTVCFCTIERAYLLGSLAYNPQATSVEMFSAGACIQEAIAQQAQLDGSSTLLMIVPDEAPSLPGERWIRIVQRQIASAVATHSIGQSASRAIALVN